jgi:hypothetical protein
MSDACNKLPWSTPILTELDPDEYALFGGAPPSVLHSDTSRLAAQEIVPFISRLHALVFTALARSPATDEELIERTKISANTLRPRRRELELKGIVRDSGETRKTRSGRSAVVWELAVK